ncbi:MAG: hypothetical protein AB3N28_08550 [Kordiimonas sp.]
MVRLDNIIRLRQWELDEVRRELAVLLGEREDMAHQLEMMEAEVAEQARATGLEVFSTTVGSYMQGVKLKQEQIQAAIDAKEEEIAEQQDKVAEGFRELKTFEIAREQEMKRIALEESREEQQAFDELGIQNHARQDAVLESEILNMRET